MTDAVHLDVVGVAVHAVPVVHHDHVGLLLAQHRRQPLGGLVEVDPPEGVGLVVLRPARHPGVGVAEPHDPGHAEHLGRPLGLGPAPLDHRLLAEVLGGLAVAAVGAHDEHDAVPLRRGAGHRPAGAAGLIVRMGVHEHQGRHGRQSTVRR